MTAEPTSSLPALPETPWDALGPLIREQAIVDGQTFVIARPDESDRLLDHPFVRSAFAADGYLPYWTDLWPAARMLARVIMRMTWVPGTQALEIGCGLGLPGIVALSKGLQVIFSDYDATALRFAADNAQANGYEDFRLLQMDWRQPPEGLCVPVILGSDLFYEQRHAAPLAALIKKVLSVDGLCLLADQDRIPARALRESLAEAGLDFSSQVVHAGEPGGRRYKGTLHRIIHLR